MLFAPTLIFSAVSGSWQLFNWHQSTKDRSYLAPRALEVLSFVHKEAACADHAEAAAHAAALFPLRGGGRSGDLDRPRSG